MDFQTPEEIAEELFPENEEGNNKLKKALLSVKIKVYAELYHEKKVNNSFLHSVSVSGVDVKLIPSTAQEQGTSILIHHPDDIKR